MKQTSVTLGENLAHIFRSMASFHEAVAGIFSLSEATISATSNKDKL